MAAHDQGGAGGDSQTGSDSAAISSGNNSAGDGVAGNNSSAGSGSGAESAYAGQLLSWLERHKEYPRLARMRRAEGTAQLYFLVDDDGQVLEYRIRRSSGNKMLDQAVLDMLARAQPLPPIPPELSRSEWGVTLPIEFKMM